MVVGRGVVERPVAYAADPIIADAAFRGALLARLAAVAAAIEAGYGGAAQDIEGVVGADGAITIVQARPQIGLE